MSSNDALASQLRHFSLSSSQVNGNGGDSLQDEDFSLALGHDDDGQGGMMNGGDDSFDLLGSAAPFADHEGEGEDETIRLPPPVPLVGGSSAGKGRAEAATTTRDDGVFFGGSMAASQAVPASKQFDPFTSALSAHAVSASSANDEREEGHGGEGREQEDGEDEENYEGYSEEEIRRIRELRGERDQLRGFNRVLEGLRGQLGGMEGKMTVRPAVAFSSRRPREIRG